MTRRLRRLARRVLEALPVRPVCRALARPFARPLAVVVCFDVEPDERAVDRDSPGPWNGFEQVAERSAALRELLAAASGAPVALNWFVRMDAQVEETWGAAGWAAERYRDQLSAFEAAGDELGLHTHSWRWNEGWTIEFAGDWPRRCLEDGLEAFEDAFGRACRAHRGGDRVMNGELLAILRERGVEVDLTVEPGLGPLDLVPAGERTRGPRPDFRAVPRAPYLSSGVRFPAPDAAGGHGPLLIPLTGVARPGRFGGMLLLSAHHALFAVRLLAELLIRRPLVLAFAVRTDPQHLAAWGPTAANLEHLARQPGTRFVTATQAARLSLAARSGLEHAVAASETARAAGSAVTS